MIRTRRRIGASLLGILGVGLSIAAFSALDVSSAHAVGPTPSTTTLTANINPAVYGQPVNLTAVVTPTSPNAATPTGQVKFLDGATVLSTKNLVGGTATYTTTYSVATHPLTATYNGDVVFNISTSATLNEVINKTATTTGVVSSANPSNLGNAVTFTATTQATAPGAGVPSSGTTKFYHGATLLATVTPANGVATYTTSTIPLGPWTLTVIFSGSGSYLGSTTDPFVQNVAAAITTTTLASNPNPTAFGGTDTLTATVSSVAGIPTGTVSFTDGTTTLGTSTLAGGQASLAVSTLSGGSHPITATYSGATSFLASASAPLNQLVNPAATTSSVASAPNPSGFGDSFTLTATVSSTAGTPTGTVSFADGATPLGSAPLSAGTASLPIATLHGGAHSITATYSGTSNFASSTSVAVNQVVTAAPSTTALASDTNPSSFGSSVTYTATVTSSAGTPTGSVVLIDGVTTIGSASLSGSTATFTISNLAVGTHSLTAAYNGATDFAVSSSAPLSQVVNLASSVTTLSSNTNPSNVGDPVTLTAAVNGAAGTATGAITFSDGASTIGVSNLTNGSATLTVSNLSVGAHSLGAAYGGDGAYTTSASAALPQTVNASSAVTTIASNANPSTFGQGLTLTATVTGAGATPTGTVTFMDGLTPLGTSTLTSGQTTLSGVNLGVGSHSLVAAYSGDGSYPPGTSSTLTQVVNLAPSATTLGSTPNPSTFGQPVTLTATVTSTAGTPTGTVTFTDGATTLGTATLTSGSGALSTSALTAGAHSITASYAGDATFDTSVSSTLSQTVNSAPTTITLASSANPSGFGTSVDYTATVTSTAGTPTGLVSLSDDSTLVGNANLVNGTATIRISTLSAGTHSLTAFYGATVNFAASTSAPLSQTVLATTTISIGSSANPSTYGQSITLTATVGAPSGTPTGTVTFFAGATSLGTGTLSGGQASLGVTSLGAGSQSLTATYGGDSSNGASTSAPISQLINTAASTTTITPSPNPGAVGQTVTLTATVTSPSGLPNGTVTYKDGAAIIGTSPVTNGTGALSLTTLAAGTHSLSAVYGGNANVTGSTSPAVTETIVQTTIYVDKANPSCKNTGAGAGLPATPYCAINSAAAKVVAGQTVQVGAGTYTEKVTVAVTGTQASPITFNPAPGANVFVSGANNGFYMTGKSFITIRGFDVNHTIGTGISVVNSSNITIDANHVSYAGQPVNGSTAAGIKLNSTTDSQVTNNITDHNSDPGISNITDANANVIAHNESFANARVYVRAAAGIEVRNSTGDLVFDNVSHDNEDSGINVWTGLRYGSSTVYDNVTYNNGDHGIDVHNSVDAHIVSNTVYNNSDSGIEMTTSIRVTLNNNITIDNGIGSLRTAGNVRADVSSVTGGCVIQDDLVFLRTPGQMFDWNGVKYTSLAALQTATGMESRGIQANPLFSSAAGANFHLLAGSPAIDSANTGAIGQPGVDFDGGSRFDDPASANTGVGPVAYADRGAFEYHP